MDPDYEADAVGYTHSASALIIRRRRGIYLMHCIESRDGTEDWDAFSTLAEAKREGSAYLGGYDEQRKRFTWEESRPGLWRAEVEWTE